MIYSEESMNLWAGVEFAGQGLHRSKFFLLFRGPYSAEQMNP